VTANGCRIKLIGNGFFERGARRQWLGSTGHCQVLDAQFEKAALNFGAELSDVFPLRHSTGARTIHGSHSVGIFILNIASG
jgi:hypothetical protein